MSECSIHSRTGRTPPAFMIHSLHATILKRYQHFTVTKKTHIKQSTSRAGGAQVWILIGRSVCPLRRRREQTLTCQAQQTSQTSVTTDGDGRSRRVTRSNKNNNHKKRIQTQHRFLAANKKRVVVLEMALLHLAAADRSTQPQEPEPRVCGGG